MKNKILVLGLLFAVTVPQIVFATWWNPASWFEEKKVENSQSIEEFVTQQTPESISENTTLPSKQEPEIIEKTVIKEVKVPVEKIVEKVIIKPDQSVINENNLLKNKIKDLETQIARYVTEINSLKAKIEILETPLTQTSGRGKELNAQIAQIDVGLVTLEVNGIDKNEAGPNYYSITLCSQNSSTSSSCSTKNYTYGELKILKVKLQAELVNL